MVKDFILHEFLRKHIGQYTLGVLALGVSGALQLSLPKLLGYIIDCLEQASRTQTRIFWLTGAMLALSAGLFGVKYVWRRILMGKARDLDCFLRDKLFTHLQSLPVKFYNQHKTGDLMAYAINDLSAIRRAFSFGLISFIDGVIINSTSLFVMAKTIDLNLTLIGLGPLLLAIIAISMIRRPLRRGYRRVQKAYADISDKTQESLSGIRVVKAYVREEREIKKLTLASQNRMKTIMDYVRLSSLIGPVVNICFGISFALVITIGARLVINGSISLGDFIAFQTYLTMLTRPVSQIGRIVEVWQSAMASVNRLDEIFLYHTDIEDESPSYEAPRLGGSIAVKHLSFAYPDGDYGALHDINLEVKAGKTLAIIGRTGSGKTTLVNMLLRLYAVERGRIFIDGTDINDIPLETLREGIGYVPQDSFLFTASIKENIEFFSGAYSEDEVAEAARVSSIYDNIQDFPDGFETVVGERGVTLSGGQRQRVSIARAIIKNPSILILDDSLSAVDTKTEEEILGNLRQVLRGRTGIIIAHRISTVKHADEIVILEDGRIVERGTHQELLDLHARYYRLYRAQMAEESLRAASEATI